MTTATDVTPNIPPSTLRNRLRDAREWRGLEQADVARELGIGRSTVSNYERGVTEPGKLVINAWAVVCEVDVEWLKTGFAPTTPSTPGGGAKKITERYRGSAQVTTLRTAQSERYLTAA